MWLAGPWSSVCPELLGAGCPPAPGDGGVVRDPHSSEFASVIYGFVLLPGTPTFVCVLPAPGCLSGPTTMLSPQLETPQQLCSSGRLPARCLQPGAPDSSSLSCHWSLRRGMRVLAQSLSESSPSLACRGPLVTMPFLSVFSDSFPKKESWRINCHTGPSCLCGGRNFCSTPLSGTRESRKRSQVRQAPRGRPPSEGAVRPCSAAVPPFLTSGVWGTETLGYLYSCSCAIREAAAPGRPAPPPLGCTRVAQTIFQIKKSSYHAGRLLYSSSSEPGPTLLHLRLPSLSHL